eukprot:CAMPEP_0180067432 /NCGR_PEP_ID=MMETSP0985-20121206/9849_1 /TAXON_ID=483367 /ORGANISM="non described non described, Strain CCMP 2436" /LENGTH=195 /DNA_ID=CAMNT_0021998075 /DNA_START=106 /DNA_END=690 /DNA_ORIENTATION=+
MAHRARISVQADQDRDGRLCVAVVKALGALDEHAAMLKHGTMPLVRLAVHAVQVVEDHKARHVNAARRVRLEPGRDLPLPLGVERRVRARDERNRRKRLAVRVELLADRPHRVRVAPPRGREYHLRARGGHNRSERVEAAARELEAADGLAAEREQDTVNVKEQVARASAPVLGQGPVLGLRRHVGRSLCHQAVR